MAKTEGRWIIVEVAPEKFTADVESSLHVKVKRPRWGIAAVSAKLEVENTDGRVYSGIKWMVGLKPCEQEHDEHITFFTGETPGKIKIRMMELKGIFFARERRIEKELSIPVE